MNPDEFYAKVQAILDGMVCEGSICAECICFQKEETGECWCDDGNDQFGFPDGCSGFIQIREEDD